MNVEVCTVWAPRPNHPKWRDDYLRLLDLQVRTAAHFGHKHTTVTDTRAWPGLPGRTNVLRSELPEELMPAMIAGVIARLSLPVEEHLVFVDMDVLIARNLEKAFSGAFDLGLTWRVNEVAPINNGAMYVDRRGASAALTFFERALSICETHWGGDQEAISKTAMPIAVEDRVEYRDFGRLAFLPMNLFSCVPKARGKPHRSNPFAIHFKGETKDWAQEYADKFILVQ